MTNEEVMKRHASHVLVAAADASAAFNLMAAALPALIDQGIVPPIIIQTALDQLRRAATDSNLLAEHRELLEGQANYLEGLLQRSRQGLH